MRGFGRGVKAALLAAAALGVAAGANVPVAAAGAQAKAGRVEVPPIQFTERVLKNGLRVFALRDTTTPNVAVSVWYDVGSKHDPQGRSGFAHLFEHILSRKTVNMPYNMINKMTEDVGGSRNASTGYDRTNYYEIVPARYLETMLWTHAERMARPVVDDQVFETERNVVKEELRQRVLAPPYGRLFTFVMVDNSFDALPSRRSIIGSIADLESAKLDDARAFHEAYYGPDTAALIVSGNFDPRQLDAWVDRYFGDIPPRANKIPLAITEKEPKRTSPRAVTAYGPNVPLPAVATTWKTPGFSHPDIAAIVVLDAILTRGNNSRLYKSLVYDRQIASQIGSNLTNIEDGGYYAPYAFLASGKAVADAEAALAAEIAKVRDAPVTAAELAEAKNELVAASLQKRETFSGRAFEMGEALVSSGDPKGADKRLAAIQKVTAADVQRVAKTYLAPNSRVDIRYLDEKQRPQGEADTWANPVPMPVFKSVPPATRAPLALAEEDARQAPPAPGADVPVTLPAIAETTLPTGLQIVSAKTGGVPIATMTLAIKGGSSTDPKGKAGLANLAADLATKGTATRTAQQIAAEMEQLGASLSSSANADGILLSVSAPAANLEAAGRVLADIAQNAAFPAEELERQRKQAIDGLSVAMKDPGQLAALVTAPILYGDAPYGTIASGTPGSLKGISRDDLIQDYRTWWHPANAALVITGGLDTDAAKAMAGRLFGGWTGQGPAPQVPAARAGQGGKARTVVIDMPGAGQAAVVAAVRGLDRADPDYYNLTIANAVLGAGSTGRLFQEVRVKRALSYGAYSNLPARADDALLTASAQTKNESAADVAKIFLDQLGRQSGEKFEAGAIEKRQAYVNGGFTRQAETSAGFGATLADLLLQGLSPAEARHYVEAVDKVNPESAGAAAARIASPDKTSLVIVGDAAKFLDAVKAIRPDVEVIKIDDLSLDGGALTGAGR